MPNHPGGLPALDAVLTLPTEEAGTPFEHTLSVGLFSGNGEPEIAIQVAAPILGTFTMDNRMILGLTRDKAVAVRDALTYLIADADAADR